MDAFIFRVRCEKVLSTQGRDTFVIWCLAAATNRRNLVLDLVGKITVSPCLNFSWIKTEASQIERCRLGQVWLGFCGCCCGACSRRTAIHFKYFARDLVSGHRKVALVCRVAWSRLNSVIPQVGHPGVQYRHKHHSGVQAS